MRKLFFTLIVIILSLIQATLINYFQIFLVKPDFLLIVVVLASLFFNSGWAITFSLFAGILKDSLAINTLGINTLIFPLWSLMVIRLSRKISIENDLRRGILIFIVVVANDLVTRIAQFCLGNIISSGIFLKIIILESLYTAIISPLVFKVIQPVIELRELK